MLTDKEAIRYTEDDEAEVMHTAVEKIPTYYKQYSIEGPLLYPAGTTLKMLEAGMYEAQDTNRGTALRSYPVKIENIIKFKNTIAETIFDEFDKFWALKNKYKEHGESHKRGFLLWGPPGGGKTSIVTSIINDFIQKYDGLALHYTHQLKHGISFIRQIEPERKMLLIFEDIDSIIESQGEARILDLLDGSTDLTNTVILATTNYPEALPDRIRNRPSRFDRVAFIGNPDYDQRLEYFEKKTERKLTKKQLEQYAKDSEEFSFAHLKEVLTATEIYGYSYEDTIDRLKSMQKSVDTSSTYIKKIKNSGKKNGEGFGF